jgi:hypothetical protein
MRYYSPFMAVTACGPGGAGLRMAFEMVEQALEQLVLAVNCWDYPTYWVDIAKELQFHYREVPFNRKPG